MKIKQHEEDTMRHEQDLQLLYKLGFEEAIAKDAIKKHPGNPQ